MKTDILRITVVVYILQLSLSVVLSRPSVPRAPGKIPSNRGSNFKVKSRSRLGLTLQERVDIEDYKFAQNPKIFCN